MKLFFIVASLVLVAAHANGGTRGYGCGGWGMGGFGHGPGDGTGHGEGPCDGSGGPGPGGGMGLGNGLGDGGGMGPGPGCGLGPGAELVCKDEESVECAIRVPGSDEVISDGGIWICRLCGDGQFHSVCINRTLDSTETLWGFDGDTCGCCTEDGTCPSPCTACPCTEQDSEGNTLHSGYQMQVTRHGRLGGGEKTQTRCVSELFTVQAQIRGGQCVTDCV